MTHKCFISFKTEDILFKEVIQTMDIDMIDTSLDEAINSNDEDYIMQKIREEHLGDSTVTIHLIGANSGEWLGEKEQWAIKRELQASLYNGENNTRNGILGIVLPHAENSVYGGSVGCASCGTVNIVNIGHDTVVKEFSHNYYIPHGKCHHNEDDRYCILVRWGDFIKYPNKYIEQAFLKRSEPIAEKIKVRP